MSAVLLLIIIYLAFISLGLPDALIGSGWPVIHRDIGVPVSYAGILTSIISCGTIISSMLSGIVVRKFKTGATTAVSVMMTAAALIGFSFSTSFIQLCLWAVPLGLGAGAIDSALNNFVAVHYKAKHMNWLHCFWGLGASAGPVILAFYMTGEKGWSGGYLAVGIIQLVLAAVLFFSMFLWRRVEENQRQSSESEDYPYVKYRDLLKIKGVKAALITFFAYCTVESVTGIWGSSYLVIIHGLTPETAARWISLYYFGITLGRFICGFISMYLNNKALIRMGQCIILAGIGVLLVPALYYAPLIGLFLIGLGCAPVFPALIHDTPENFGRENSQAMIGFQMACAYAGTTFMPPLFGYIGQNISFALMPFVLIAITGLMIFGTERLHSLKSFRENTLK